jgi:hypothetical protein
VVVGKGNYAVLATTRRPPVPALVRTPGPEPVSESASLPSTAQVGAQVAAWWHGHGHGDHDDLCDLILVVPARRPARPPAHTTAQASASTPGFAYASPSRTAGAAAEGTGANATASATVPVPLTVEVRAHRIVLAARLPFFAAATAADWHAAPATAARGMGTVWIYVGSDPAVHGASVRAAVSACYREGVSLYAPPDSDRGLQRDLAALLVLWGSSAEARKTASPLRLHAHACVLAFLPAYLGSVSCTQARRHLLTCKPFYGSAAHSGCGAAAWQGAFAICGHLSVERCGTGGRRARTAHPGPYAYAYARAHAAAWRRLLGGGGGR